MKRSFSCSMVVCLKEMVRWSAFKGYGQPQRNGGPLLQRLLPMRYRIIKMKSLYPGYWWYGIGGRLLRWIIG